MFLNKTLKLAVVAIMLLLIHACSKKRNQQNVGLKNNADFPIGTAIKIETLTKDSKLQNLQKLNFNSITSASDMKMNRIMPREGVYDWSRIDKIVDYAQSNNQRLFGHNLIWHSSTPKWVEDKALQDSLWLGEFMKVLKF